MSYNLVNSTTGELTRVAGRGIVDTVHIAQNTANFAPAFSEVVSYAVGDYVTYNNVLYRCTTAHTAGVWVAGHFTAVTVGGELVPTVDIVPIASTASSGTIKVKKLCKLVSLQVSGATPASVVADGGSFILCTLPAGYRPPTSMDMMIGQVIANALYPAMARISSTGTVTLVNMNGKSLDSNFYSNFIFTYIQD